MVDNGGGPDSSDPKYAPGAEQARQDVMIGVSVAMTLFGMIMVALRVYTRAFVVRNMGLEDWTIIAAAMFTIAFLLEIIAGAKEFKMGFSGMSMTMPQMEGTLKVILAIVVTYKMAVTLIKISILLMYLRLAIDTTFTRLCQGTILLLLTWQLIVTIVVPAQCTPLEKLWDFTGDVKGRCINANAFYHTTSIFHIVMDIWILLLPIKLFRSINRPAREKLVLVFIFSLGVLSMIASIVRLQSLRVFTLSKDPFYDSLPINTWSMVEVNIGILCASLSTLRPLISKAQRFRTQEALQRSKDSNKPAGGTFYERLITLTVATVKDPKDWESESGVEMYTDIPPPVPPKDEKYDGVNSTSPKIAYPEMAYHKI